MILLIHNAKVLERFPFLNLITAQKNVCYLALEIFTCLSLEKLTYSDQVSVSMDCSWDSLLISFPHEARFSPPGPVDPYLESRERSHLVVGSPCLASRKRGPEKDQPFFHRCREGGVRRCSMCHPVTSYHLCSCLLAAAPSIW